MWVLCWCKKPGLVSCLLERTGGVYIAVMDLKTRQNVVEMKTGLVGALWLRR